MARGIHDHVVKAQNGIWHRVKAQYMVAVIIMFYFPKE